MKYIISQNPVKHKEWIINEAAINMLIDEVGRPDLVDMDQIETLVSLGLSTNTVFVVECDDAPVGVLGALILPNTFKPSVQILVEMFWYVLPEFRKGRAGYMLLKAYSDTSKERGIDASASLLPRSSVSEETMAKFGFHQHEVSFLRRN